MADQKNRGGQKQANQKSEASEHKQDTRNESGGQHSDRDKQADQTSPSDVARRQSTNQREVSDPLGARTTVAMLTKGDMVWGIVG